MDHNTLELYNAYEKGFKTDQFLVEIIVYGEKVTASISNVHKNRCMETIESLDMKNNSECAWALVNKFYGDSLLSREPA